MLSVNINNVTFITIENVDYRCIIHNISKSETIILLQLNMFLTYYRLKKCVMKQFIDQYKIQEIYGMVVSEDPFLIVCCPDKYKTQKNL